MSLKELYAQYNASAEQHQDESVGSFLKRFKTPPGNTYGSVLQFYVSHSASNGSGGSGRSFSGDSRRGNSSSPYR